MTRRKFVGVCSGAALLFMGVGISGYIERMLGSNQSTGGIIKEFKRATGNIRFIVVGDPHVEAVITDSTYNISDKGNKRLEEVVNFINKSDVDFAVFIGDIADDGTAESNELIRAILKNLNKKYYVVAGNHDLFVSNNMFGKYFGPMERIEYVNGYQLLFVGIYQENYENGTILKWSFDFNKADKNAPTLVFIHGPVTDLPAECVYCQMKEVTDRGVLEYAKSIRTELDKFTNLIGVYSGHIHYDTNQVIDNTRYVTVNGLNNIKFDDFNVVNFSDKVGYSTIKGGKSYYELVSY